MAIFIWGEKEVEKRLGWVADYCPLCRDLRAFELFRVGIAGHIYYITLVEGRLAGYRMRCQACRTGYQAEPERYARVEKKEASAPSLAATTFPAWRTYHAGRLALEKSLADPFAKIAADQRQAMIREPFRLLAPRVEKRFGQAFTLDGPTLWTLAGAILAFVAVAEWQKTGTASFRGEILAATAALGLAALVVQIALARGRYFRKVIFPILVPALRPLRPRREEIETVLGEMKALDSMIARKVKVDELLAALASGGGEGRMPR